MVRTTKKKTGTDHFIIHGGPFKDVTVGSKEAAREVMAARRRVIIKRRRRAKRII